MIDHAFGGEFHVSCIQSMNKLGKLRGVVHRRFSGDFRGQYRTSFSRIQLGAGPTNYSVPSAGPGQRVLMKAARWAQPQTTEQTGRNVVEMNVTADTALGLIRFFNTTPE